jgi:hypothetical protein
MSTGIIILVAIIIFVIILIILLGTYVTGLWKPVVLPAADIQSMIDAYSIPSAWTSSLPTDNGECQVYTFVSTNGDVPQPSIDVLNANETSKYEVFPIQQSCTDDDQIFAQHSYHVCRYGELPDIPITQFDGCPLINGGFTKINGYYEEYYNTCGGSTSSSTLTESNSTRCLGSVALIAYDYTSSLASSTCIVDPVYTIDGSTIIIAPDAPLRVANPTINIGPPISFTGGCSITATQNGFPSELFRVTRYAYDASSKGLTQNNNGSFIKITHRPTGKCIAPYTLGSDGKTVSVSSFNPNLSPILVDASSFGNYDAWWYITPRLNMSAVEVAQLANVTDKLYSLPQLVWMPNPNAIGGLSGNDSLWDYLTNPKNNVYSLVPFTVSNGTPIYDRMSMQPFLTYKADSPSEADTILPPTNKNSLYYPSINDAITHYIPGVYTNPTSACFGYNFTYGGFITTIGIFNTVVPLNQVSPCYKEYTTVKYLQYEQAILGAKARILAEAGAFNYINLTLYNIITNDSSDFYNI